MSFDQFELLTGLASLIAVVIVLFTVVTAARGDVWQPSDRLLGLAALVALACMAGSLVMSDIYHPQPCVLCWWQRIFMYPLAVLLPLAAARRDLSIRPWALALSVPGIALSLWHSVSQRIPSLIGDSCEEGASCAATWVYALRTDSASDLYLSIPNMALIGFITITVLLVTAPDDERTLQ